MAALIGSSSFRGVAVATPAASSSGSTRSVTCMAQRLLGTVSSNKGDMSAVVSVERMVPHPIYGKRVKTTKRYTVHDPENKANIGDFVELIPTKPISKTKRFILGDVVREANVTVRTIEVN